MPRQGPPPRPRQSQAPRVNPRPLQGWQQQGLARATAAGNRTGYLADHPGVMSNQVLTARQGGMPTYAPPRQLPRPRSMRGQAPPQIGGNMGPQQPSYQPPQPQQPQPPPQPQFPPPQQPLAGSGGWGMAGGNMGGGDYGEQGGLFNPSTGAGGGWGMAGGSMGGSPQPRMGSDSIPGGGGFSGYSPGMQSILQNRGYPQPPQRNQPPQWGGSQYSQFQPQFNPGGY